MKSFSKRVASFAMAATMVFSLVAVSPADAEAASRYSLSKKSSITAGKTYTYNVKGVSKNQYIKVKMSSGVTVKYGSKNVKYNSTKITGGKTLALKVKAADKVANYKATLKAIVYNKKNNKRVKGLTTTTKVKCTKLEVKDVTVASTSGKYLVATFNKALSKLSVADIEIRNLNTSELKGVEKVELSSDGKSATITLVGSEDASAGVVNSFVEPNVEYSFKVSQSGATASTNFTVDAVKAYVTVYAVNPALREISYTAPIAKNSNTDASAGKVKLPESVNNDDFQELLGRTVNVWYNKNNVATKLTKVDEEVVYGSFKYYDKNTATPYFQDKATNEKYYISKSIGGGSDIHNTYEIETKDQGGYKTVNANAFVGTPNDTSFDYMKLVRYSNGTIRTAVYNQKFNDKLLVTKVEGNLVYSGDKYSVNFEGFTVLKAGKSASVKDINVNDVVFVNTTKKFAEIYTTTKTGKIEATYDTQFKFDGTLYLNDSVKTIKDNAATTCNYDIMKAFVAGGADVTVYLDRANQPVFVMGTQKYAASSTETVIITEDVTPYRQSLTDYVRIKGFDGKNTNTYDIAVGGLEWIYFTESAAYSNKEVKYVVKSSLADGQDNAGVYKDTDKKIETHEFRFNTSAATGTILEAAAQTNAQSATSLVTDNAKNMLTFNGSARSVVELTKNDKGVVVGLTFKKCVASGGTDDDFVGGKSTVKVGATTYQIKADTPVFAYDKTGPNAGKNFRKVTYADYSATTPGTDYWVYTGSTGKPYSVAYVVVQNNSVAKETTYVEGVVGSILTNDGKATEVVLYNGATATTYKDFANDSVRKDVAGAKAGAYINLGIAADGKTVVKKVDIVNLDDAGMTSANMSVSSDNIEPGKGKFTAVSANGATTYELAKNFTIVKRVSNLQETPVYEKAEFSELGSLKKTDLIYIHEAATGFVDAVIIQY